METKTVLEEVGIEMSKELESKANNDLSNVKELPKNLIEQVKKESKLDSVDEALYLASL